MDVGASLIDDLGATARRLDLGPGDLLVAEGEGADEVFYVRSGSLEATRTTPSGEVRVGSVGADEIVGEVTVVAGGRRTATLRAVEPTEVAVIDRGDFEQWLGEHAEIADRVSAQARARIDRAQVAAMIAELVGDDDGDLVQRILDRVEWLRLGAGSVLFEQGDHSDAAYFIVTGRVMVAERRDDGAEHVVAELGRGEVVGELGLLDGAPRSATVRSVRDTTLARFPTSVFEELVMQSPGLMLHVARGILTRLRRSPRRRVGRAASLAIAVTAPVDAGHLLETIVAEVQRFGSVRHLSSRRIDELLNRPAISQAEAANVGVPRLAEFMHEADVGNEHVVLETDPDLSPWTRRALRRADRALIVASARPSREERRHVEELLDELRDLPHVARMVALVHPPHTVRPSGTAAALAGLDVDEIVHVREGSVEAYERLARLASGHGIGLVLSGGGARGFAHIGVYHALRECGVPVDQVAGCSIGAPLAGGIALGVPDDEHVETAERQFHKLLDYTLPMVSLIKGERISRNLEATFGDLDIEDTWLPFYCVSTNLTTSTLEVHRRGPMARAIRASVAIPGVLPPVPQDGELLVDGGVLNNLPFEQMRADGTMDTIIASDVAPRRGPRAKSDYGTSVSGVRALASAVTRRGPSYPTVSAVLLRSMLTGAVRHQQEAMRDGSIDLMLELHLPGIGLLDFERVREVARAGHDAALPDIRRWVEEQPWVGRHAASGSST